MGIPWHETVYRRKVSDPIVKGFLLIYSITDRDSFDKLKPAYETILSRRNSQDVPIVLCRNKCDLETKREVTKAEGEALASMWNCPFFETSAKEKTNYTTCFFELVRQCRKWDIKHPAEVKCKKSFFRKFFPCT